MSRIKIIQHEDATGRLSEIYNDLIKKRGKLADVHKIQSLRPESIVKHMDLYMEIMFSKSELSRAEREMMAVVVSAANNCEYCQVHHALALNNYWKDEEKVKILRNSYHDAALSEREYELCEYSHIITVDPGLSNEIDFTIPLKNIGLSDNGVLDATLVVAYFNFVNRIILSLGVELEKDGGGGYKY
ncbi:MAG: peroxidase-related enzyme [Bacteroidales bacterium]